MQMLLIGTLAGVVATIINLAIAKSVARLTTAPSAFAPFSFLPIATGCIGGSLAASAVFYLLHLIFASPLTVFVVIVSVALLISFHLPFRLTNHVAPRFAGATLAMQATLCLMHFVVAATSVAALRLFTDSR